MLGNEREVTGMVESEVFGPCDLSRGLERFLWCGVRFTR